MYEYKTINQNNMSSTSLAKVKFIALGSLVEQIKVKFHDIYLSFLENKKDGGDQISKFTSRTNNVSKFPHFSISIIVN